MKKFFNYIYIFILIASASCGESKELFIPFGTGETKISDVRMSNSTLVYGEANVLSFNLDDATEISHLAIRVLIDNAIIQEERIPILAKHAEIEHILLIPFNIYSLDKDVVILLEVLNKDIATTKKQIETRITRPLFNKLYFETVDGKSLELIPTSEAYEYAIDGTFDQYTTGFVYSQPNKQGYKWGMNFTSGKGELNSDFAFELEDSNASDISRISFDAVSFAINPLRTVMSVDGVEFFTSADNDRIKTASVNLTEGAKLEFELLDLATTSFDPIYFKRENDDIIYVGKTGSCKLFFHEEYQFMFVENETNKLSGEGDLYINGWGLAWPDLWKDNPNWNFDEAIILKKYTDGKYHFTLAVSQWANFKFYTDKSWSNEVSMSNMTIDTPLLAVEEESGKPGNYNIYYKPQHDENVVIVRFTYDYENNTLDGEIIKIVD